MFCRHGTYVGTPHGADHLCGACEDGADYVIVDSAGKRVEREASYRKEDAERIVRLQWALGYKVYVGRL